MYPTVNDLSDWLRRNGFRALSQLIAASLCCFLVLGNACTAVALSDTHQLVVDSWRLVNQGFWNPGKLDAVRWKRQRQKAMERSIESSDDAYAAIESMLAQLGDPYTRLLRPEDYTALKNSTNGNLSGVGLQLGPDEISNGVVVISALEGSPAGEAEITSGTQLLSVDGMDVVDLGLEGTVAALRGDAVSYTHLTLPTTDRV